MFRLMRDDVMEATAGRLEPFTYGLLPGRKNFFFLQKQDGCSILAGSRRRPASIPD